MRTTTWSTPEGALDVPNDTKYTTKQYVVTLYETSLGTEGLEGTHNVEVDYSYLLQME